MNRRSESGIAIIPCRGGSKRLPGKNGLELMGRPMLQWVVEALQRAKSVDEIHVTSDDPSLLDIAAGLGCETIERPQELAGDTVPKMLAIRHAVSFIEASRGEPIEFVLSAQANSPEIEPSDVDRAFDLLNRENLWEVFSVNRDGVMNAAFRWLRRTCLENDFLSANMGVVTTDYIDVHTERYFRLVEERLKCRIA